jgi:hypothetical protein
VLVLPETVATGAVTALGAQQLPETGDDLRVSTIRQAIADVVNGLV